MSNDFVRLALELGELVTRKNEAYGDSVERSAQILEILYPGGVGVAQYDDMLLVVRILDKLSRIATDKTALEESPWRDIAGYALLGMRKDEGP